MLQTTKQFSSVETPRLSRHRNQNTGSGQRSLAHLQVPQQSGHHDGTLVQRNDVGDVHYSYGPLPVISTNKTPFIECIIPFITSYN